MIGVGTIVRIPRLPPWFEQLPEASRRVVAHCVGRTYPVVEIDDQGLLVLDVSQDVDASFGGFGNDLRVEPDLVEVVGTDLPRAEGDAL